MRKIIIVILTMVVSAGAILGVYDWQNKDVKNLEGQQQVLTSKVINLQKHYTSAKDAAEVSMAGWKKFCDQFLPFCFSYPSQWTVLESPLKFPGDDREYATISSPDKTLQINYVNPLIKDGGSGSVHIIKASHITVGDTSLSILGAIPVSSGIYGASYVVFGGDQALSLAPSDKAVLLGGSVNPRFTVGKYDSILLTGYSTQKMTSYAQAKAWFDSVDGKTIAKILESFSMQ